MELVWVGEGEADMVRGTEQGEKRSGQNVGSKR